VSSAPRPDAVAPGPAPRGRTAGRLRALPAGAVRRVGLLVALVAVGGAVALAVDLPDVATLRSWLTDAGPVGWAVLAACLALATLAPVPRTALSVLAGVLAGFWGGLALALGSGVLGALAGFGLARWLGRETVTRLAGPRLARADALLTDHGVLAVLIGRLVPVTPFTLVSYAGGLSGIPMRSYLAGSTLGIVPGTVLHVALGATVGAAGPQGGPALLLGLVPLALTLVVLAAVRLRRRRAAAPPGR